jgi:hypothetical protein
MTTLSFADVNGHQLEEFCVYGQWAFDAPALIDDVRIAF